ncbi:hypothetical protein SPRG_20763 [Saprolegnia parasitica CBS 223.65]|uniref:Uncharacterized protein n=1 Tax=Saprolegnia parasitica (strain CBS 223.65) TaxID=695850 RepID=A0A067CEI1_SAPPC|nr:hypothetical protein SPRG_20763 [Saprolegnia parasitica CBS 223.65]KDO25182.1 hypothetical protein SPRG_20763 [Saprolegnia parasitica CBS 223.65]|eukprot:XP_012204099.1 hypothetical protein SPRG_20763 [Saprolegnia parasitica CBS 223.65]
MCPVDDDVLVYLDSESVSVATYLSDTVSHSAANNGLLVVACIAAVAVVASVLLTKKTDGYVSMEDGYTRLADDTRYA